MSSAPERFAAGVAMYGFVHNRWMSYEGGDFTWEDEYIAPPPMDATGMDMELVIEEGEAPGAGSPKPRSPSPSAKPRAGSEMSPTGSNTRSPTASAALKGRAFSE